MLLNKGIYIPPSFQKNVGGLHRKRFSKDPLFTTFSLSLTLNEVYIFQINTDFPINQLKKYFHTKRLTPLLHFKTN